MTYYTFVPMEPFELARVAEVNARFEQAAAAFALLPAPTLISQQRMTYTVVTGTANALIAALPVPIVSYNAGLLVTAKLALSNTGPATINVDGLGAVQIVRPDNTALEALDMLSGAVVDLRYDGTAFRVMGGINPAAVNASTLVAQTAATAAAASATAAAAAATTASGAQAAVATNATNAATSASAASTSATAAASSASAASTSASGASTSASNASTSASAAAASATTANTKAGEASTSASNAATSATAAAGSATTANTKAGEASTSASNAAASAASAASSAGSIDGSIYLQKADNLLALANKATSRTNLGVAIGSDVQAFHAILAALAGVSGAASKFPYFTGASAMTVADITATGLSLLAAADATAVKALLGLAIGSNVQAFDADLTAIAALTSAADRLPYFSGSGSAALATFTAFARTLLDDADANAMKSTLGLVIGTNVQAFNEKLANLAALTISGGTANKAIRVNGAGTEFELYSPAQDTLPELDTTTESTFTTATAASCAVPLSASLTAGSYRVSVRGLWLSTATGTGLGINLASASTGLTMISGRARVWTNGSTFSDTQITAQGTNYSLGNATGTSTPFVFEVELFLTATLSGTFEVKGYNSGATGNVKILAGSTMITERLF